MWLISNFNVGPWTAQTLRNVRIFKYSIYFILLQHSKYHQPLTLRNEKLAKKLLVLFLVFSTVMATLFIVIATAAT